MLSFNVDDSLLNMSFDCAEGSAMFSRVLKQAFDFKGELTWPIVTLKKAFLLYFLGFLD